MKKAIAAIIVSFPLTGCVGFQMVDLTFRAASAIDPPMPFESTQRIEPIEGQKVYGAKFKPSPLLGQKECGAEGVIVDYARDWDVIDEETGEIVIKADPDKIYDQAVLVYKLFCEGKPEQTVLMTTDRHAVLWFWKSIKLRDEEVIQVRNYFGFSEQRRPRWLAQVLKTIQEEAPTNPAARDFLDNVEIRDGLPVKTESSESQPPDYYCRIFSPKQPCSLVARAARLLEFML